VAQQNLGIMLGGIDWDSVGVLSAAAAVCRGMEPSPFVRKVTHPAA
jgi:hypothetical protein